MKKSFALHSLSLAIMIASGSVQADSPNNCVNEQGTGESMKEWGIWCGVETFLTSLTEQDPTAAGPAETDVDIALDEVGRGDAEEFEPGVETTSTPVPAPAPEPPAVAPPTPEPEPEPIAPHITLNEESSGYVVSYDLDFPEDTFGEGPQLRTLDSTDEGGGPSAINPRVGTLSLSLNPCSDECGYYDSTSDYGYEGDTGGYVIFNQLGQEEAQEDFENGYAGNPSDPEGRTSEFVYIDSSDESDESDSFIMGSRFEQYSRDQDSGQETFAEGAMQVTGSSVPKDPEENEFLKNLLAVFFGERNITRTSGPIPGTDAFEFNVDQSGLFRAGVHGTLTAQSEIDDLMAGQVQAFYGGVTGVFLQQVQFEVDFGNSTFEGSFGDANFDVYRGQFGLGLSPEMFGAPEDFDFSFQTSGVIEGTELISTSVFSNDGNIDGFVQGSFFETGAAAIGGAYQVTKLGVEFADAFVAIEDFLPAHIGEQYYSNEFEGYYADIDFLDGEPDGNMLVGAFGLDVEDSDSYEGFNGYADSEYFGAAATGCDTNSFCQSAEVNVVEDDSPSSFASVYTSGDGTEQWSGREPSVESDSNEEVLKNYWNGFYIGTESLKGDVTASTERAFVAGVPTPLSDINSLINDNISLVYTGSSLALLQSARIEVDFGNRQFDAQFGDVDAGMKNRLGIDAATNMSFTSEGRIIGQNLISTSVSPGEGFLQGTFFGAEAAQIGGAYNVTISDHNIVDVFTAVKGDNNVLRGASIPR